MYDFFIQNYTDKSGTFHSEETLAYSIPYEGSVDTMFIDPVIKNEMGKAGSFEFSVEPFNLYYSSWHQMRTVLRVEYDGETIFRGRVLTIDDTILGQRKIHCEGDFAFLLDSMQEGVKEEKRKDVTLENYLESLIASHNGQMGDDTYKHFQLGQVPGKYTASIDEAQKIKNDTKKFGSDAWETTMSAFERIRKECGGFFRTRYVTKKDGTGACYLDWLESYFRKSETEQEIEVGENLIDLNYNTEVNNIFTALIPIGSKNGEEVTIKGYKTNIHGDNNRILVPQLTQIFSAAELKIGYHTKSDYANAVNNYGIIYKVQKFQNADTQEKLWNYATDWMKNNYYGGMTSFSVSAIDLHHVDDKEQQLLIGDRVTLIYPNMEDATETKHPMETRTLTVTQATYYPYNPEKGQYSIGVPNSAMEKTYGNASNKKGGGGGGKPPTDDDDFWDDMRRKANADDVWARINDILWDAYHNSLAYRQYEQNVGPDKAKKSVLAPAAIAMYRNMTQTKYHDLRRPASLLQDGKLTFTSNLVFDGEPMDDGRMDAFKSILIDGYENKISLYQKRNVPSGSTDNLDPTTVVGNVASDIAKGLKIEGFEPGKSPEDPGETHTTIDITSKDGRAALVKAIFGENAANNFTGFIKDLKDDAGNLIPEELQNDEVKTFIDNMGGIFAGKEPLNPNKPKTGENKWVVKINTPITYTDKNGNTATKTGSISAEDLQLREVDSFATQFILAKQILAESITTKNIDANIAKITGAMVGRDVTVGTLRTATFYFNGSRMVLHPLPVDGGTLYLLGVG